MHAHFIPPFSMDTLIEGPLPGCETLEQAESNHLLDATQMKLRERRIYNPEWNVGIKEVQKHYEDLKQVDPAVYVTALYTASRLGIVCSDLTDEQVRNALNGLGLAMGKVYSDWDVIRPTVHEYRRRKCNATPEMLLAVRDQVRTLLPKMLDVVAEHAEKEVEPTPRVEIARGVHTGGRLAEEPLSPALAQAVMNLRAMIYLRHPIDLLREITNWEVDMEHSE